MLDYDHNRNFSPVVPKRPAELDYYKIYEAIWRNMERENALISYRATWGLVFSAGNIAGQGLIANLALKVPSYAPFMFAAMLVLSFFALVISRGSWRGVDAALAQIDSPVEFYHKFGSPCANFFERTLNLPRPFGKPVTHKEGHWNAKVLPRGLCLFWASLCVFEVSAIVSSVVYPDWLGQISPQQEDCSISAHPAPPRPK